MCSSSIMQEDAYDAVKTHMFDLLAAVASECQPSQLDMLFAKLERRQARSVQDLERLLALLESLADSDSEVSIVWQRSAPWQLQAQLHPTSMQQQPSPCRKANTHACYLWPSSCRVSRAVPVSARQQKQPCTHTTRHAPAGTSTLYIRLLGGSDIINMDCCVPVCRHACRTRCMTRSCSWCGT